ncbi:MAG: hypothetical protein HRF43_04780, partial [Phycisphaerae bacterium]
ARAPNDKTVLRLWVDANHPVVHVEVESPAPSEAAASFELWRKTPTTLPSLEVSDVLLDRSDPPVITRKTVVEPDTVLTGETDAIGWYHRNGKSVGPELTMRHQDLLEAPWKDPLLHRVFGALIRAENGRRIDDQRLESPAGRRHRFSVYVLTRQPATAEEWRTSLDRIVKEVESIPLASRLAAHRAWWADFWARSRIDIRDAGGAGDDAPGRDVARGYALQRFITACAGRGAYPIKFNGSIFTVAHAGKPGDADYRRWGPGYWWQNTRLPYESMCAAGDFEMMRPLFRMYAGEVLAVCEYRTRRYFGIEGAYFPECIYPWGAVFSVTYGWRTSAAERTDKLQADAWHKYEWVGGLELVGLMQDYYDHTQDRAFLADTLLRTARPILRFFDNFYRTGPDGKLVMHPAQALETWWDCTNPMPELAGLHSVCNRLLDLPEDALSGPDRAFVAQLRAKLPPLPTRVVDGETLLAPAERFARKGNIENPELYAVFPFRLVSFEKDNAELGRRTLGRRTDKGPTGWRQDDIFMAYLGLAAQARDYVVQRARSHDPQERFPAFWGPNYDWTPDQDHGSVLMKAVQAMLMQTEGRKIFLLPAWPKEWDVDFKLHAPFQTTVEGRLRGGKLEMLRVEPESRRRDVEVFPPQ